MPGEVVPLKPPSAEQTAHEESKHKKRLLKWAAALAEKVIKLALEDANLRFRDNVDDEESDLTGAYDPIVNAATGSRLSEHIKDYAAKFRTSERALKRLYQSALAKKWQAQERKTPSFSFAGDRYGKYLVDRHGVWAQLDVVGIGQDSDLYVWRRIARTRIDPVARSRDTSREQNWRHVYRVTNETGQFEVEIDDEHLGKAADSAIRSLMRRGVHVVETKDARQHLAKFLRYKARARIIRAPKVGWFQPKEGSDPSVFVLPTTALGNVGPTRIVLDKPVGHNGIRQSGTSGQWGEHVAKPLAGNSNVVLAVGLFLAGPLFRFAGEPGGGFHFFGKSKIGKTLAAVVGQSVWGKPYYPGAGSDTFGFTWETTAARLGQRALSRNDIGLYLDEIGVGDPKAIANAVYKLAGGLDKGRFGQAEQDFNVLFLSTGEPSLAEFLPNASGGQLVRLVDIPAEVQNKSAFERIAKIDIDAAGKQFYAATKEYYGAVGYDLSEHLVALGPEQIKAELKRLRDAWWALPQVMEIAGRAHPQVVSVVGRFGLVAAALHMTAEAGLLPWTAPDIDAAIIACMERWVRQRGNTDAAGELLRGIRQVRQTIAATIDDRFIHLRLEGRRLVPASAADQRKIELDAAQPFDGFVKDDGRLLVRPEAWRRLWAGLDLDAVKNLLLQIGLLIPSPDGRVTTPEKFRSGQPASRFYVLAPVFIE